MATLTFTSSRPATMTTDRLLWAGALTAVLATSTNMVIYLAAESLTDLSGFWLLNPASIVATISVAAVLATIIYGLLGHYTAKPTAAFTSISSVGLLLSFLPILALLFGVIPPLPNAEPLVITAGTLVTLIIMHLASAATIVGMLTTVARDH
ncbi:MAG: hypothetical protein KF716_12085 [Anaerolineae bacterium]|nr:hypothetical protein [Anaerolineae bacterium]